MELLVAQRLTRLLEGSELFGPVDLRLASRERLGLVGPNGSGKSTLLRTLAGVEEPDGGRLWRAPGVRVGYLPQHDAAPSKGERTLWQVASLALAPLRELEERLREEERRIAAGEDREETYARLRAEHERLGGFGAEALLRKELAAVGFGPEDDGRSVARLSAGERRRLALAATLAAEPDVLLLDEPTNHLDLNARVRLARRLAGWHGAVMVISHDRALLDEATNRTAFLEPSRVDAHSHSRWSLERAPYSVARDRRDGAARATERRERERQKEARRLEAMAAELATFGRKATARRRAAVKRRSQLVAASEPAAAEAAAPRLAAAGAERRRGGRHATLLEAEHLSAPGTFTDVALTLTRGERIALLGPNGSGKSSLLRLVAGETHSGDPRATLRYADGLILRYVDQTKRGLEDGIPILEQAAAKVGNVEAHRLLAGAGLPPRSWSNLPEELSGGERARAGLALTLAEGADLWLLDEPTNDLDLAAVEALEGQLAGLLEASGAALVLATHDRRLAERLAHEVWSVESGSLERYRDVARYLDGEPLGADDGAGEQETEAEGADGGPSEPGRPARGTAGRPGTEAAREARDALDALEGERLELLRLRDEAVDLTERERTRLEARLLRVEEALMEAYASRLPAPPPSYRVLERGAVIYADLLPPAAGSSLRLAVVAPVLAASDRAHPAGAARQADAALAATAAAAIDALAAGAPAERALLGCAAGWVEVLLLEQDASYTGAVGHLRLVERVDACLLPHARARLVDAGAHLAFTRLGAQAVQLHHDAPLVGTLLAPAGDGWWSLGLGDFLAAEGWRR